MPTDADFFNIPSNTSAEATLRAAWELTAPTLAAQAAPGSLPSVDSKRGANNVLTAWPALHGEEGAVLAWFSEAHQGELQPVMHSIPRLAFAVRYADLQLDLFDDAPTVRQLLPTATEQRRVGLHWADIAAALRLTSADTVARIRAGRGHDDKATDLQALSELLTPLLPTLLPLQASADAADRIDADALKRMETTGHQLLTALRAAPKASAWLQDLRRVVEALHTAWTDAHRAWAYHRSRVGGEAPPTFFQLARRG